VDLARLAGCHPSGVICEIMKDDGTMARLPDLIEFAGSHGLKIGTIADLIQYRSANESLVERVAEHEVSTASGVFRMIAYRDKPGRSPHLALVRGQPERDRETLVRVHEPLTILDLLEVGQSTHSWSIHRSLEAIAASEAGVLVLLNCAQPGENLFSQFEDLGRLAGDAPANAARAKVDLRTYGIGAQILKDLGVGRMRLLAQPRKMPSMTGFDLEVVGFETDH